MFLRRKSHRIWHCLIFNKFPTNSEPQVIIYFNDYITNFSCIGPIVYQRIIWFCLVIMVCYMIFESIIFIWSERYTRFNYSLDWIIVYMFGFQTCVWVSNFLNYIWLRVAVSAQLMRKVHCSLTDSVFRL